MAKREKPAFAGFSVLVIYLLEIVVKTRVDNTAEWILHLRFNTCNHTGPLWPAIKDLAGANREIERTS